MPYFYDEVDEGQFFELGNYTFTREAIITFATDFDPQPFHLDEEAAKNSLFGTLVASGWHTACGFMRTFIDHAKRVTKERLEKGETPGEFGPSPGIDDVKWIKPVLADDTISYTSRVLEKRVSKSIPHWGIIRMHNEGHNQKGELVFSFISNNFIKLRPDR